MSKVLPAITAPGSDKFPTRGPHNPNIGRHGKGGALARVKSAPSKQTTDPMANLSNRPVGQAVPNTAAAATKKPNRKGGAAFYGEM